MGKRSTPTIRKREKAMAVELADVTLAMVEEMTGIQRRQLQSLGLEFDIPYHSGVEKYSIPAIFAAYKRILTKNRSVLLQNEDDRGLEALKKAKMVEETKKIAVLKEKAELDLAAAKKTYIHRDDVKSGYEFVIAVLENGKKHAEKHPNMSAEQVFDDVLREIEELEADFSQ